MPYIKKKLRYNIDRGYNFPTDVGELNYRLTTICDDYLRQQGRNYANLNSVIGVLECAKLELYRRIVAPYEDTKIEKNGDVYDGWSSVIRSKAEAGATAT